MEKPTLISEMQKFHFGTKIFCTDGEEGVLSHVGLDPTSRRLNCIGVRLGRFFARTVYLPFSTVTNASGDAINLDVLGEELAAASKDVPAGAILDHKSVVQHAESSAKGTLSLVAVQPGSGKLAYIVVHNLRPNQRTMLRENVLTSIQTDSITVSLPEATLHTLPPYRSDDELQREVEDILFDLTPLHVDFRGMKVRVLDSVLYLDGNISSSLRGDIVEDQASGVQGLLEIKNRLIGDDKLAGDLAMALGRDPRTRDLPIGVYPRLGVVRLSGAVHNEQQKEAVKEIARAFPGVRSVVDELVVDPKAAMLYVMSPAEGGEAEDKVPGKYTRHTQ